MIPSDASLSCFEAIDLKMPWDVIRVQDRPDDKIEVLAPFDCNKSEPQNAIRQSEPQNTYKGNVSHKTFIKAM